MDARSHIAIVGMACRFPGGAGSPDQLWDLLVDGRDAIREWPPQRWDAAEVYDPDPGVPGKMYVNRGGSIDEPGAFDAGFFAMSPREAIHVDPQHRLLLELAYEALEDGGIPLAAVTGTDTGVFVGISTHDYGDVQVYPSNRTLIDGHSNVGSATSLAANRISYMFDLRGPSMIVDTACSSSLTAVHLAVGSLRRGECGVALVGGVQLVLAPELTIGFGKASMLSPDGRCAAFDAAANGYVRSEGGAVVVLKPLADAVAAHDRIYAVIAGTAVNQDGRTLGMTVPSSTAQEAVVRAALADSGIHPSAVGYVEAHGTGTPVGDPIEANALGAVFAADHGRDGRPALAIGSVKTNVGHLEAASGMAGLCKAALAVQRGEVPRSLHFSTPNPDIDFERLRLRVVTEHEPWPGPEPRVAGVNSFGFGGANAHVVVTAAPGAGPAAEEPDAEAPDAEAPGVGASATVLLPLSARTPEALAANIRALADHLGGPMAGSLAEVCRTAARRRSHHEHRWIGVASDGADMTELLDASAAGERRTATARGRAVAGGPPVAFVFSGMGPLWWGMARQLILEEPVFASVVDRCDEGLRAVTTWSLRAELLKDEESSRAADADLAQVTNFAVQMGLVALWAHWGVRPGAVIGHSAGEIAASCAAGALTLEEAVILAWHRSQIQSRATGEGTMLAVGLPADEAAAVAASVAGSAVSLAAVNGPESVTLSGTEEGLAAVADELTRRQVFARLLKVSVPYHSPHMDRLRDAILAALAHLRPRPVSIPMASVVTADWVTGDDLDADYWWRAIRQPVLFAAGLDRLLEAGYRTFVEIAPHPVLGQSVAECVAPRGVEAIVLPSIRRKENDRATMLRSAGALWTLGTPLDWDAILGDGPDHARLPRYQWARERHWFESRPAGAGDGAVPGDGADGAGAGPGDHPLLGRRISSAAPLWQVDLGAPGLGWLRDHVVRGTAIQPAAAYVETALAAARLLGEEAPAVRDVTIPRALVLGDDAGRRAQCSVTDGVVSIHASDGVSGGWELHAKGRLGSAGARPPDVDAASVRARCPVSVDRDDLYQGFRERGLDYGAAFGGITSAWQGPGEAVGVVTLPDGVAAGADGYLAHPALLDAAFQMMLCAADGAGRGRGQLFVPVRIDRVAVWEAVGRTCQVHARLVVTDGFDEGEVVGAVILFDEDGRVLLAADGLRCRRLEERAGSGETVDDWLYELRWEAVAGGGGPSVISDVGVAALAPAVASADRVAVEQGWDAYYRDVEPVLEAAAAGFAWRGLVEAGWDPATAAGPVVEGDVEAATRTVPGRRPLLAALIGGLVEGGWLRREDGTVAAASPGGAGPSGPSPAALLDGLAAELPAYATDAALLARCGAGLAGVLQGRVDAAQVLFADEGADLLAHFYRDAPASRFSNTMVTEVVGALVAGRQTDRPLRVLEVGGGTGGTTAHVLGVLPAGSEYTFTDISPRFTQAMTGVATAVVDVEHDLEAQGIAPGAFDLVIGANVVHATADAGATVARLAAALAPGGRLVLVEITRTLRWLDVVFGITDGWWAFADLDTRPTHALLPPDGWRSVLQRAGYTDVTVVADDPPAGPPGQSVLVATWPGAAAGPVDRDAGVSDRQAWAVRGTGAVADSLRAALGQVGALASADGPADGVVHVAAGAGGPDPSPATADLFDRQLDGATDLLDLMNGLPGPVPAGVCVVTASAQVVGDDDGPLDLARAPLWGLLRVAMKERPDVRWQLVDLPAPPTAADIDQLAALLAATGPAEDETAIRGGRRLVRRLRRLPPTAAAAVTPTRPATPSDSWRAGVSRPGALETCALRPMARRRPGPGQVEVEVDAAGLNFRDVVLAMGLLPSLAFDGTFGEQFLGLDVSGRVVACGPGVDHLAVGDPVFGIGPGTMASHTTTSADLVTLRPPELSAVDGAASPCAFVTALYALDRQARLVAGERVLIHSGTGGVGLAAIQIARLAGAEILATAGSEAKRDMLRSMGIAHVFDSRGLDFADEVLDVTDGAGVDVVLNSLAGEAIARGIATLAPFGRFVELGKRDIYDDAHLGLLAFRRNLSFFAVDLDRLCRERPHVAGEMLREVAALLADGSLEPLPVITYPVTETGAAIRLMGQARHTGKIVLEVAGTDPEIEAPVRRCRSDGTYLVTGGTGGFGLATAAWLVEQGAGAVVVVARHLPDEETAARLGQLEADGARIVAMTADVGDEADVARVLGEIGRTLPPLRGVVHAAMVLDDATLGELDRGRLERNMHAKVLGAWNLHRLTADADLDLFVCFSSIAALLGNAGQGGYAAANAFLQALAHHRRAQGLPALTVDWGVIADVGYVASRPDLARHLDRQGYRSFAPVDAFACLERLLDLDLAQGMAARVDWRRLAAAAPDELRSSRLGHFTPVAGEERGTATVALSELLSLPGEDRLPALVALLRIEVAAVLGVSPARVELDRPLPDLGFDSLIAVELAAVVQLRLGVELPLVRLLQDATVNGLAALVLDLAGDAPPPAPTASAATTAATNGSRPQPDPDPVPTASVVPPPPVEAPVAIPAPVAAVNGATNGAANGASRYESLDYRRWSPVQRAIKGTISTALRAVMSTAVEGGHHLDTPGPYLLVTNHMALIDVPLLLTVTPRPVIVLAASEYRSNRITDWFLADKGNAIYVDRGAGDVDALDQALVVLRAGGIVGLSPEGRRSHTGSLERAHNGVAYLAARAGVPVVPMAVWGQEAIRETLRKGRRSAVKVRVGAPIPPPATDAKPSDLLSFTTAVMVTLASMLPERYRGVYADAVTGSGA